MSVSRGVQVLSKRSKLEAILGHSFVDSDLLDMALTHRSATQANNERLEFLGDAILGAEVADFLYRQFPFAREGELSRMRSKIVRAESLASVARRLNLGDYLALGPGETKSGGHRRASILGDAVEALIGAVFLDGGSQTAKESVLRWFADELSAASLSEPVKDAKTQLQEWLQQRSKPLPHYQLVEVGGQAHQRVFTVSCRIDEVANDMSASASSRRKAEQLVAELLLEELGKMR